VRTNVEGTQTLMEACREYKVPRIIHFSTDEVYGELDNGFFNEESCLDPTNPYSASKAAADMLVKAYIKSFNLPVTIVRPNNIYGTRQHWEKLIPTCITHLKNDKPIPIHGDGEQKRTYLSIEDLKQAIGYIINFPEVTIGETYNIGTHCQYSVLEVAELCCQAMNKNFNIIHIEDRPHNDCRYGLDWTKIKNKLHWEPYYKLEEDINYLCAWYYSKEAPYTHGWYRNE